MRRGTADSGAPHSRTPDNQDSRSPTASKFPGGHRGRVTPVPIPNTEVKPATADGTACVGVWESRSLPGFNREKGMPKQHSLFLLDASCQRGRLLPSRVIVADRTRWESLRKSCNSAISTPRKNTRTPCGCCCVRVSGQFILRPLGPSGLEVSVNSWLSTLASQPPLGNS